MLDLREIAELEEARQAAGIADVAIESWPVGGGRACRAEPGTWACVAVGIGLSGPVEMADVDRIITWFEGLGIEPRFEVCPFAHESLIRALGERRFSALVFENVFFRELSKGERVAPIHEPPRGIEIRRVPPDDARLIREYALTVASGFIPPGEQVRESEIQLMERAARHPRSVTLGAFDGNRCIGGGAMELSGPIAALFGLSVLPEYRRRGIQQAMIAQRLNIAAESGARVATIGSRPGVATERNVRRMGFQVAYSKAVLVRPGPGLARVRE